MTRSGREHQDSKQRSSQGKPSRFCSRIMFHVEHFIKPDPILHINFHSSVGSGSRLIGSDLEPLFHVEQSSYPRDCTNVGHCRRPDLPLASSSGEQSWPE